MFISISGYRLIAFVSHMGTSTMCGHYVCHILKEGRYLFVLSIRLTTPWAATMNRYIPRCDWLSGQAISRSGLLAVSCEKIAIFSSNKSFIDQGCSFQMAEKWPRSFLTHLWASTSSWSINSQNKGQYPAILTEQAWSITQIACFPSILTKLQLPVYPFSIYCNMFE